MINIRKSETTKKRYISLINMCIKVAFILTIFLSIGLFITSIFALVQGSLAIWIAILIMVLASLWLIHIALILYLDGFHYTIINDQKPSLWTHEKIWIATSLLVLNPVLFFLLSYQLILRKIYNELVK